MFHPKEIENNPFIIAEVGQNHNGDLDLAREYIRIFAFEGADAVKFQTRNNQYLFSEDAYTMPYKSENAFADTYGEHRERLELKPEWLPILKADCERNGVKFMSTPFDEPSLELLSEIGVDILKIASFDLGNLPFINKIGALGKPVVVSVGGGKIDQIQSSIELLLSHHNDIAILHCVSEYPCEYNRLGLNAIKDLINEFPKCSIGLSDHFNGILSAPIAYMNGARVFEKHVTLNRAWKGTDHSFALEPDGFRKMVRDVKRVRHMLPQKPVDEIGTEKVFEKLGKSLIAAVKINTGETITMNHLSGRIFREGSKNDHIPVRKSNQIIGKKALNDILVGAPVKISDVG
jgi:sialic acid synthase